MIEQYHRLELQLAYLVHFAQYLRQVASHFTYSALQISLTLIFQEYVYIYVFLFGHVPLAGRICQGL